MRLKPLPDPHTYANKHVPRLTKRYLRQVRWAGVEPDTELIQLIVERAGRETSAHYDHELNRTHLHNLQVTQRDHHKEIQALFREHTAKWKALLKSQRRQIRQIKHRHKRPYRVWRLLIAVFLGIASFTLVLEGDLVVALSAAAGALTWLLWEVL